MVTNSHMSQTIKGLKNEYLSIRTKHVPDIKGKLEPQRELG